MRDREYDISKTWKNVGNDIAIDRRARVPVRGGGAQGGGADTESAPGVRAARETAPSALLVAVCEGLSAPFSRSGSVKSTHMRPNDPFLPGTNNPNPRTHD